MLVIAPRTAAGAAATPAAADDDATLPNISMDVPSLPPHLPGMIKIHLVENGFLDDLRKARGKLEIVDDRDVQIPRTEARLLKVKWRNRETQYEQAALLMIHANRVYILRNGASFRF